jgi:uncharacterized NAD(P)/FAD-binding protein YdhS
MSWRYDAFRIAIVGGGFSGTLVAAHLLRRPTDRSLHITMVERASRFAAGVAYGTRSPAHLLNVPAGKMSAFVDDPQHFLRWAQRRDRRVKAESFLARRLYGEYLRSVLEEAKAAAAPQHRLDHVTDAATAIDVDEIKPGAVVTLRCGRRLAADRVVLALGNYPPADPPVADDGFYSSQRYIRDPWDGQALGAIPSESPVLLIGTGLTMCDVAISLLERGHRGSIYALSRHGLLPQAHRPIAAHYPFPFIFDFPLTVRRLLRTIRHEVRAAKGLWKDWRAVTDSLRPITQEIWRSLAPDERRRFLRHVRHYWEAHRHRVAPEIAATLNGMIEARRLTLYAGRVTAYREDASGVDVLFRPRRRLGHDSLRVEYVVNCTGPNTDFNRIDDPLIKHLRRCGHIRPDELGLGIETTDDGALISANGTRSRTLYTLGPPRKGQLWETTAVPEIRAQAAALARDLIAPLRRRAPIALPA